ncbi:MAG: NADH-binding protein, partial [Aeromicrobium sp.]
MMQQAAEEMHGRRLPIKTVPVLTPGLSSRWIALVTDVDTTTANNLIDSMSTEVVVDDHSIDDLVPRDVLTYRQSVRRALDDAAADTSSA